jgi:hypothetical protein
MPYSLILCKIAVYFFKGYNTKNVAAFSKISKFLACPLTL